MLNIKPNSNTYDPGKGYSNYFDNLTEQIFRYDIINTIINNKKYKSYLEIGTAGFDNFDKVYIEYKECIDPNPSYKYTYNMTSDEAFKQIIADNKKYDIIFIDGLHFSEQVTKDINNSLLVLNKNGTIILHDCNPPTAVHASNPMFPGISNWNGDCYKSIINFRISNPSIFTRVVHTDWGVGIIEPFNISDSYEKINLDDVNGIENYDDKIIGGVISIENKKITWKYFNENRKKLLNLISVEEFRNL